MAKRLLCIDPGQAGALAVMDKDGTVTAENMPDTMPEIADRIREIKLNHLDIECVLEKVGMHRVGNNASASVKFSRHVGNLEAILYCMGIPTTQVTPQKWMKKMGSLPKDKKDRKNKLKLIAATRFPHIRVTLKNADALCMLMTEM
jgi:hypothetical protein